jgi:ribosomal-protein-alanine N-acetyltransferase
MNQFDSKQPDLETKRLLLRKMTLADAEDLLTFASSPDIAEMNTWERITSLEDAKAFIQHMDDYANNILVPWGIEYKSEKRLIGICGLVERYGEENLADMLGVLSKAYWGKGIMTEAMQEVFTFAFNLLKLHRIEGKCFAGNTGAEKVMQKLGMSLEGVLRQRMYWKGTYHDLKLYGILRREWS